MNKSKKITIVVMTVLLVASIVFVALNRGNIQEKAAVQDAQTFSICVGEMIYTVTMADMEKAGITDVAANYKPSGKAPVERIYQGVPFEILLQSLGIDLGDGETVLFTAADGYATGIPMEEAMDASKCVIAIGLEGEPLGSKADGGSGPYMMILPSDQFSQRWCKFLFEVSVQ